MRRSALLLLLLVAGWLGAGIGTAGPAAAHATLVATEPGEGARVDAAPGEVTLRFSEGVALGAGYARVLGADQQRVDTGSASVDGDEVTIPLRSDLPDGGYLVTYRVISADSHPVSGAFSFAVGDGELLTAAAQDQAGSTDPVVGVLLPVARWVGYAGLALALGVPALVLTCRPAGRGPDRLRRMAAGGAVAVAGSALATFLLQGPYAAGTGLGAIADPALLGATARSGVGWAALARVALALALLVVLRRIWRGPTSAAWTAAAAVLGGGLVLATAAVGHPVAGPWPVPAVLVAAVHVGAMAIWLGGLAGLLAAVVRPGTAPGEVAAVLPAFSRLAFGSVVALVVSGIVQSVREVGSPTALVQTTYGQLLAVKLLLVVLLLAAAGVSRVWVQQRLGVRRPRRRRTVTAQAFAAATAGTTRGGAAPEEIAAAAERDRAQAENAIDHLPSLRRSVLLEAGVAAVVLALSAVLVATPPARTALAQPVETVLPLQGGAGAASGSVQVSVDPARPGENALHVYLFDDAGRLTQPAEIRVTLTERSQEIGPLDVDLAPAGPGHFVGDGMAIPGAGTWTLTVTVRLDEFTALSAATDFPVR
ncbi:copper resistance CopC/CopD family protein [Blastococcus sp. VKM Ac-2987]|uniref:copper resistance CopC/CopD family protein n=1 Tax=Blastococcus sp. VKM Ac-2987 TaxID=3004141 RepID=UPI0022ABAA35|nr:copper resistance CopC family protein [Blastococcus sp. VKM Ac-2987]MCZ2857757.1 copper resistance protein CopC [Blastococcus sp. VKM Ac-2987]